MRCRLRYCRNQSSASSSEVEETAGDRKRSHAGDGGKFCAVQTLTRHSAVGDARGVRQQRVAQHARVIACVNALGDVVNGQARASKNGAGSPRVRTPPCVLQRHDARSSGSDSASLPFPATASRPRTSAQGSGHGQIDTALQPTLRSVVQPMHHNLSHATRLIIMSNDAHTPLDARCAQLGCLCVALFGCGARRKRVQCE